MNEANRRALVCPQCGGEAFPAPRRLGDRLVSTVHSVGRYRCRDEACGWEGIVSSSAKAPSPASRVPVKWSLVLACMGVGLAIAMVGAGSVKLLQLIREARLSKAPAAVAASAPPSVPFGESFDGLPLPREDARAAGNATGLSIRQGCAWGVPGRNPYKGTVTQALQAARLPEEVVRKVDVMVSLGIVSDQVVITSDSIRAVRQPRRFDSKIVAMGFANTLCFGTRVNFEPGHVEFADLYDATDAKGNNFAVMVPYVCGNVAVLAERAERDEQVAGVSMTAPGARPLMAIPGVTADVAGAPGRLGPGIASARNVIGGGGANGPTPAARTVPEPGTLASLIAGFAAMAVVARIARRGGGGRRKR